MWTYCTTGTNFFNFNRVRSCTIMYIAAVECLSIFNELIFKIVSFQEGHMYSSTNFIRACQASNTVIIGSTFDAIHPDSSQRPEA